MLVLGFRVQEFKKNKIPRVASSVCELALLLFIIVNCVRGAIC